MQDMMSARRLSSLAPASGTCPPASPWPVRLLPTLVVLSMETWAARWEEGVGERGSEESRKSRRL